MFNPEYRITPYFIKCAEEMAAQIAFIKRANITLPLQIKLEREFISQSVHSSTWIEGNRLSLEQVVALAAHKNVSAREDQEREVANCIQALKWVLKHGTKDLTEKRLLRLHEMMTKGLLSATRCGKYRKIQNYIVNARKVVIFTPPAPRKIKQRMKQLLDWLKKHQNEHPIVRNAIFHHEFVTIHPFVDGNGRVARAASQWLLFEQGYDPLHTLSCDDFFAADRARYYNMIQQTRDLGGDYTYWIDYVAEGLLAAVQAISERLKVVKRPRGMKNIALTPKQEELLKLISEKGGIGSSEIMRRMQINRARVHQLIAPLVKAGIVEKEGKTRGVRYGIGKR